MVRVGGEEPFRRFSTVRSLSSRLVRTLVRCYPSRVRFDTTSVSYTAPTWLEGLGWPGRDLKGMLKAPPAKRVHLLPPRERDTV